ncbi:DNA-binding NarL/FixJ family response regulator [Tenggerimyces flavus]|nr:DNA-binding NarL/FixJ family response regulator [Tenggerimyces flavus]
MAEFLSIGAKTVELHCANLLQKLVLGHRLELTRYSIRTGSIEP